MATQGASSAAKETDPKDLLVIDLGRHRKGRIRGLRKGRGRLFDDVKAALEDLKSDGSLAAGAQPIVVIVREKQRRGYCN
jgi:hypothetical protein